jgi:23S rRNA (guanosine2251-2'-O)-methyltransferase
VVVGRRPVLEAVRTGAVREILVATSARGTAPLRELVDTAGSAGVPVRRVDRRDIEAVAGGQHHQGVAARIATTPPIDEAALGARDWPPDAVVVVLDGITDPHNVGAIGRTAEAAGASALVLRARRGGGVTPAAIRASAGALLLLPVAVVPNVGRALGRLRQAGFWIVGLDDDAETALDGASLPGGPLAVVIGSEGGGLSRLVREACDVLLAIPLSGRVSSLNASVAAGVALFSPTVRRRSP